MSNIVVGITGGIAAYKAIDFVNGLTKTQNKVKVVMTNNAQKFIKPLSFPNAEVYVDSDEWNTSNQVLHIELAKWADAIVIYPGTANTIAKLTQGIADNLLTCTWLASTAKKIVFPAMNTEMLNSRVTFHNLDALSMMKNVSVMTTEEGKLACGDVGKGKVVGPRKAVLLVNHAINYNASAKTILVTSGGTKAPIDGVRVVTNISSGALGAVVIDELLQNSSYNIVHVAPKMSVRATLGSVFPQRYRFVRADTVEEVYKTMKTEVPFADAVIHSMAISDFTFDSNEALKIKSNDAKGFIESMKASIKKSPKIIQKIKEWNPEALLIGFKFEVGVSYSELVYLARKQIEDAGSNYVLVNDKKAMNNAKDHIANLVSYTEVSPVLKGKEKIAKYINSKVKAHI